MRQPQRKNPRERSERESIRRVKPAASRSLRHACDNLWMSGRLAPEAVPLNRVCEALEQFAPLHLAEKWDNVGLLLGDPQGRVQRVLLTIDLTPAVRDEALRIGADLLIAYHPPLFKPVGRLLQVGNEPAALAASLAAYGIAVYSPHTALDVADGGTNDALAAALGAKVTGSFQPSSGKGDYLKLVTFVPEDAMEKVAAAIFAAGAGHIGVKSKYTQCSFRSAGTGTFFGDESTNPAVGQKGQLERVHEIKFETILPAALTSAVVMALKQSHPYEEPAFDLVKLHTPPEAVGLGRLAEFASPQSLQRLAQRCKALTPHPQVLGDAKATIRTIGLLAGSAGRLPLETARGRMDALITGELKHHDILAYHAAGVPVICLGHAESERPVLPVLQQRLRNEFPSLEVQVSTEDRSLTRLA